MPTRQKRNEYRRTRRQSNAFLTREQIFAAHKIYVKKQLTIREVADLLWEKYGYKNRESCERNLSRSFTSFRLPVHNSAKVIAERKKCFGCGEPMESKTPGCKHCTRRHYKYRKEGRPEAKGKQRETSPFCVGCGCHLDVKTPGCARCISRHSWRRLRGKRKVPGLGIEPRLMGPEPTVLPN